MGSSSRHTERSTLAACIAQVVAVPAVDVPLDDDERRAWLAERGLGLVPVADVGDFAWPGSWIGIRPARDGGGPRAVVMFGVPSGVIWDPAGTEDALVEGFVVAPLELATWPPVPVADVAAGVVEALAIAPSATAPVEALTVASAVPDRGLRGDRYWHGVGTFASGRPGSALTLVDADVLDELAAARGAVVDHRRNVVVRGTDLNALVGRAFLLGSVRCRGRRLCEPCAHLDRLNGGALLRPMVHRGGLRADILEAGEIRVGDALTPCPA
ncbi:MOSC domain-containing protein [Baekduia alba]|uniref:MOSC domain-containing protein n=1 Tax=Baekduia alba TaxID=2997333 RepID=UPI00233FDE13|nr:MOSC domain-containing protein [Baekduia alba]